MSGNSLRRWAPVWLLLAVVITSPCLADGEGAQVKSLVPSPDGWRLAVALERQGPWTVDVSEGECRLIFPAGSGPELDRGLPVSGEGIARILAASQEGVGYVVRLLLPGCRLDQIQVSAGGIDLGMGPGEQPFQAQAESYLIGVGDQLKVGVFGQPDLDREVRVAQDGSIPFPYLGNVPVAGRSVKDLTDEIESRLAEGFIRDPQVTVEVMDYKSQWVNVSGQVENPGRYYLKGRTTVVDAIALAGGLRREAGSPIRVIRDAQSRGEVVFPISHDGLYLSDDSSLNMTLQSGDSIVVPSQEHFYIKGAVRNPGEYALNEGTTILRAISLAGGFGEFANPKRIELLRQRGEETEKLVLNVQKIENRKEEDIRILPGDIINVPARFL